MLLYDILQDIRIEIKIKRPRTEIWGTPVLIEYINVLIEYINDSDLQRRQKATKRNDAHVQGRICFIREC